MTIRAKFQVQEITDFHWDKNTKKIVLRPSYDSSIPEDQRFYQATPMGDFWMNVNNPAAIEQLKLGGYFYIDLTVVPS